MAYTLSDLRAMVMDAVGEDSSSPTYWDASTVGELDEWIHDAVEEICLVTGIYTEELVLPMFANRKYYTLDPGKGTQVLWIKHIRVYPEGGEIEQSDPTLLSRHSYTWMTSTGIPQTWFQVGQDIVRFIPYPASDGYIAEATVVCIPATYTASDEKVDLPDYLTTGVVSYAVALILASRRRFDKVQKWLDEYATALGLANDAMFSTLGRAIMPQAIGQDAGKRVDYPT